MATTRGRNCLAVDVAGGSRRVHCSAGAIHRESVLDSGVYDTPADLSYQRILPADGHPLLSDGWYTTGTTLRYALGIPAAGTFAGDDGVVGIGGRQGANAFGLRLVRLGHVYWPSNAVPPQYIDIGGAPTYARSRLDVQTFNKQVIDQTYTHKMVATWSRLWTTPGGGQVDMRLVFSEQGSKEEISINAAGQSWLRANRWLPWVQQTQPAATLSNTYQALVYEIDWTGSAVSLFSDGEAVAEGADFEVTNRLELRTATGQFVAFLPVGALRVSGYNPSLDHNQYKRKLRVRFYTDAGRRYMLVGLSLADIESLAAGDLIYDPPVSQTANRVAEENGDNEINEGWVYLFEETLNSQKEWPCFGFDVSGASIGAGTYTVSTATISIELGNDNLGTQSDVTIEVDSDPDAPVYPNDGAGDGTPAGSLVPTSRTALTPSENFDVVHGASGTVRTSSDSGNLQTNIADLLSNANWPGTEIIYIWLPPRNDNGDYQNLSLTAADHDLDFTYNAAGGAAAPRHYMAPFRHNLVR